MHDATDLTHETLDDWHCNGAHYAFASLWGSLKAKRAPLASNPWGGITLTYPAIKANFNSDEVRP